MWRRTRRPRASASALIHAVWFRASKLPAIRFLRPGVTPTSFRKPIARPTCAHSNGVRSMAASGLVDRLDQWIDSTLPKSSFFRFVAAHILVPFWASRTSIKPQPGGPRYSVQAGDNVQRMMNLIMPLKDKSPVGRALAALAIAQNKD